MGPFFRVRSRSSRRSNARRIGLLAGVLGAVLAPALRASAAPAPDASARFVPLGRWRIDVLVDGVPQAGPRAFDKFRKMRQPIVAEVRRRGSVVVMSIPSNRLVFEMIPDGRERPDGAGETRWFYLAPNALGHTHRSTDGLFDEDVCTPAADGRTLSCPGVLGDQQGKLHTLLSTWTKLGE